MLENIKLINYFLWGTPLLFLLMGTHIFFTFRLKFIQTKTLKAIALSVKPEKGNKGDFSSFGALATTLAATLGTGNIIGVSTAIAIGGPGAVFWCWLTGILGMATSYAECYLSCIFKKKTATGDFVGGPMYILENGLKNKFLAIIFALLIIIASYGVGCSTQANAISLTLTSFCGIPPYITGIITAITIGLVIVGGVKKIATVCMKLVPAMGAIYIIGCIVIFIINFSYIPETLVFIVRSAFTTTAIAGGLIGGTLKTAMRYGIARGLFTNEAGLGTAGIAAASSTNPNPESQSLISMTATFWDTIVMCALTGIIIISTILKNPCSINGLSSGELATAAFRQIPYVGEFILSLSLVAFAAATLIGWSYFGEKAVIYLFGTKGIQLYRLGYIIMIFFGAILSLEMVWEITDLVNAMLVIPNILCLLVLSRHIYPPKC